MKFTIEKLIFGFILAIGFAFLIPSTAEAAITGFPDDWAFSFELSYEGSKILLDSYNGTSSTVVIEGAYKV